MKTMTYDNYLRLIGLLTLAADHRKALHTIENSACALTGQNPRAGNFTSDVVWGGELLDARQLLERLEITLEEPKP